jgi:imidazole glycerol-phosphate synthase subunit HisF
MKSHIHFGASNRIFINAKALRNRETFAEKLLWSRLRNNQLGYHFRRQHPLSNYVVDFYCEALKLIIEVDGSIHADPIVVIEDKNKEESLVSYGLVVIRFTNDAIVKDVDAVVQLIRNKISEIEQ